MKKLISLDTLYKAITNAETAGEKDPWIRTKYNPPDEFDKKGKLVKEIGSTAFGPAQITLGKINLYAGKNLLTPETEEFVRTKMIPMQNKFNTFGASPNKKGYDKRYDYGGSGEQFSDEDKEKYKTLAKEMIALDYQTAGLEPISLLSLWKDGSVKPRKSTMDSGYIERFNKGLNDG